MYISKYEKKIINKQTRLEPIKTKIKKQKHTVLCTGAVRGLKNASCSQMKSGKILKSNVFPGCQAFGHRSTSAFPGCQTCGH